MPVESHINLYMPLLLTYPGASRRKLSTSCSLHNACNVETKRLLSTTANNAFINNDNKKETCIPFPISALNSLHHFTMP